MSTYKLEKVLRKELGVLNDIIDEKIVRGLSYVREARRHKFLVSRIAEIHRASRSRGSAWLEKSLSFVSLFLF